MNNIKVSMAAFILFWGLHRIEGGRNATVSEERATHIF
jgi:hypothetical protein